MASYRLVLKASAREDLQALPTEADRQRVAARIESLASDPRPAGCRKLTGSDHYRVRQGRFRIVHQVRDRELVVLIVRMADRRGVERVLGVRLAVKMCANSLIDPRVG
ncbi:MAG: type II toxin-antitoxin system RelE/ParE family toxin [Trueperaceae bacterium]